MPRFSTSLPDSTVALMTSVNYPLPTMTDDDTGDIGRILYVKDSAGNDLDFI